MCVFILRRSSDVCTYILKYVVYIIYDVRKNFVVMHPLMTGRPLSKAMNDIIFSSFPYTSMPCLRSILGGEDAGAVTRLLRNSLQLTSKHILYIYTHTTTVVVYTSSRRSSSVVWNVMTGWTATL